MGFDEHLEKAAEVYTESYGRVGYFTESLHRAALREACKAYHVSKVRSLAGSVPAEMVEAGAEALWDRIEAEAVALSETAEPPDPWPGDSGKYPGSVSERRDDAQAALSAALSCLVEEEAKDG